MGSEMCIRDRHWAAKPGAGPRHVAFHPSGKWLYSLNELDSTISVLAFDATAGSLELVENLTTLPDGFEGGNTTAEVVLHPSGKYLFASNRGHESTVVFHVDNKTGKLNRIEHESTGGKHPRFIGIAPAGKWFVAANMNTSNIVSFRFDAETGDLKPSGFELKVNRPMCVLFVPKSSLESK